MHRRTCNSDYANTTVITAPITNFVQSTTGLDLTVVKDKIIGALTGTSALALGGLVSVFYGFWNRGKQLSSEIAAKLQWKSQAVEAGDYATALTDKTAQMEEQSKTALEQVTTEKEALTSQLSDTKTQLNSTLSMAEKQKIELETLSKQAAANWQSALPANQIYTNQKTGAQILKVTEKVIT